MNNEAELVDIKKSMDVILEYIAEVRQCLRQLEKQKKLKEERSEEEMKRVPDTNTGFKKIQPFVGDSSKNIVTKFSSVWFLSAF
jgi:hypothetical protein